jgi:hypothetical protein
LLNVKKVSIWTSVKQTWTTKARVIWLENENQSILNIIIHDSQ